MTTLNQAAYYYCELRPLGLCLNGKKLHVQVDGDLHPAGLDDGSYNLCCYRCLWMLGGFWMLCYGFNGADQSKGVPIGVFCL